MTFAQTREGPRSQSDTSYYQPVFANHAKNLRAHAHKVIFLNYQLVFANKILDSDFSGQNTPVETALLKLQMLSRGTHEVELIVRKKSMLNFTNEIHDDNEETTEDDVREPKHSWRHCENCEKKKKSVFGFYRCEGQVWQPGGILNEKPCDMCTNTRGLMLTK